MVEMQTWNEREDDQTYHLDKPDPLRVLESTRQVVEQGESLWINHQKLKALSQRWTQLQPTIASPGLPAGYDRYHFYDGTERTVNWVLVLDALNFCFWAEKDQPRWAVDYQGKTLNGYWAEAAALTRAVEEGKPLWDAEYLSNMSSEELAQIFRGKQTIPLFEQRLHNIQEVGRILTERFGGQFSQAIEQANQSAPQLALLVAEAFPSFYDVTHYRQAEIRFFKRAQILVSDLHGFFQGQSWGTFNDLDQLTAFADYKLPQLLRHFGVLEYDPALAERVDRQELIPAGSELEVEIRAATIWACELLRRAVSTNDQPVSSAELDQRLWLLSQNIIDMRPYHRTYTQYY